MQASVLRWGVLAAVGLLSMLPQTVSAADPCKLLTVQEVGQVVGGSVSPQPLGTTGCLWKGNSQRVSIVLRDATAWALITTPVPTVTKTDVSGIGDAAQYSGIRDNWTLSVKKGSNVIILTVAGGNDIQQERSSEESLARLALGRL